MYLECTCSNININTWNQLMKNKRRISFNWLKRRIKKHLPELYNDLSLDYRTFYEEDTYSTKTHYILTHSAIEYFIRK